MASRPDLDLLTIARKTGSNKSRNGDSEFVRAEAPVTRPLTEPDVKIALIRFLGSQSLKGVGSEATWIGALLNLEFSLPWKLKDLPLFECL